MDFLFWQLWAYGAIAWICWIVIAFCGGRFFHWFGFFLAHAIITGSLIVFDFRWIQAEIHAPDWNGVPDRDILFFFGLVIRIFLINSLLLPVSIFGLCKYKNRSRNTTE